MNDFTRRDFVRTLLAGGAGMVLSVRRTLAQTPAAAPAITVTKLSDSLAVLSGDGGNVAVLIGPDGLMMIDGGLANRSAELAKSIAAIDGRRVQVLFNTHYHFDHVGSNERLGRSTGEPRVRIIAHENVKTRLGQRMNNAAFGRTFEPLAAEGLPTETFVSSGRFDFGDNRVDYSHVPPAHTDGDAVIVLTGENALHAGDLLWIGRYPVIDYSAGGSLAAMVAAVDMLAGLSDETTRIIPGHGPVCSKAQMKTVRDTWAEINQRVETLVKQGRTVDDIVAAVPTREFDATFGAATRDAFLRQTYGGIVARQAR